MQNNIYDSKTIILHGKNLPKSRNISIENVKTKAELGIRTNTINAASLENKIDTGTVTVPKFIPREVSIIFQKHRTGTIGATGLCLKQAAFAQQCNVSHVDAKFIQQLESGQLLLNHHNKTILRALQQKCKIAHFDLP